MSTENEKKDRDERKGLKRQYIILYICSYIVLVAPLLTVLGINHARYFTTTADAIKVGAGAVICLVLAVLLVGGKLKVPSSLVVLLFVFIMSWLLGNLLEDLMLLSGVALAGKVVDWIFFEPRLKRLKERIAMNEQADVSANALAAALGKTTGRV